MRSQARLALTPHPLHCPSLSSALKLDLLYKRLADRLLETRPELASYFPTGMGHEELFRAGLVNFRREAHDGNSLCAVLDEDSASAIKSIFEGCAHYFKGLGFTRRWPMISRFVVPALQALALQDVLDVELLAPRGKARDPTLGLTVLESLSGCRFRPSDFRLSAVHSGLDARGGKATADEQWLHWASESMVRAQLHKGELDFLRSRKAGVALEFEFALVAPVVSIEPLGIRNGPIEIEIKLAVQAESEHWDQCELIYYDADLGSWRLARHAQLDDEAQLGARPARQSVERRDDAVFGRVEAKHASFWSAITWRPQSLQIQAHAFLSSNKTWVHILFGMSGDGELSRTLAELHENSALPLTIASSSYAELLALSVNDRIEVKLVGAQGPPTRGWDTWRHRAVPRVDLPLAGLVQPVTVTFTSTAGDALGPRPLDRRDGLPLFSTSAPLHNHGVLSGLLVFVML